MIQSYLQKLSDETNLKAEVINRKSNYSAIKDNNVQWQYRRCTVHYRGQLFVFIRRAFDYYFVRF